MQRRKFIWQTATGLVGVAIGANSFCISMTIRANFDEFKPPTGIARNRDRNVRLKEEDERRDQ